MNKYEAALERARQVPPLEAAEPERPQRVAAGADAWAPCSGTRAHTSYGRIVQRLVADRAETGSNALCLLGALPGEGTSTVARNLATAIALALPLSQGSSVLLIDAAPCAPQARDGEGGGVRPGLGELLAGSASLAEAVLPGPDGFALLGAGRPARLALPLLDDLVADLRAQFDWVLVDSPPAATSTQGVALAVACGAALLVVRAESTRWEVVAEMRDVLQQEGVRIVGAVLNRRRHHIPDFIYRRL